MHQENWRDLPDLQFLGGISVRFAVSAEDLVVICQPLLLGEQPQTILGCRADVPLLSTYSFPLYTSIYTGRF